MHRLLRVGNRDRGFFHAVVPLADHRARFVVYREEPEGVVVSAHILLEVQLIHSGQRGLHLIPVEEVAKADDVGVPLREKLVDFAPLADLILDFLSLVVPVLFDRVGAEALDERFVGKVDFLDEMPAVKEIFCRPFSALFEEILIFSGFGIADEGRHLIRRFKRAEVESLKPARRAEKLHVECVMLTAFKHSVRVGVPAVGVLFAPRELKRLFDARPELFHPLVVAGELPFAPDFDYSAELSVGAGAEPSRCRLSSAAERKARPEDHSALLGLIVLIIVLAEAAFEVGEEIGHYVGVVPDVRAGSGAGTVAFVKAFPAVEIALFADTERGFGLQHRRGRADRFDNLFGQSRGEEFVVPELCRGIEPIAVFKAVIGGRLCRVEEVGIVVSDLDGLFVALHPLVGLYRIVPRKDEADVHRLAWREGFVRAERRVIALCLPRDS